MIKEFFEFFVLSFAVLTVTLAIIMGGMSLLGFIIANLSHPAVMTLAVFLALVVSSAVLALGITLMGH